MNNNVIKGLLGLCLLLLLVLIIEWLVVDSSEQAMPASTAAEDNQAALTELPKLKLAKETVETYSEMVERPLFIKGRKPIADEAGDAALTEEVGEIDDLILLGIYSIKGKTTALFKKMEMDRKKPGKRRTFLKKSEGEDVAGWLLKEIETDRVVMEQRGKEQTIMLRKPKPKRLKNPRRIPRTPSKKKTKIKPRKTA